MGLFKPRAVTASSPSNRGIAGDPSAAQDGRLHPDPLSQSPGWQGLQPPGLHMPHRPGRLQARLKCGDLCFLSPHLPLGCLTVFTINSKEGGGRGEGAEGNEGAPNRSWQGSAVTAAAVPCCAPPLPPLPFPPPSPSLPPSPPLPLLAPRRAGVAEGGADQEALSAPRYQAPRSRLLGFLQKAHNVCPRRGHGLALPPRTLLSWLGSREQSLTDAGALCWRRRLGRETPRVT